MNNNFKVCNLISTVKLFNYYVFKNVLNQFFLLSNDFHLKRIVTTRWLQTKQDFFFLETVSHL